MSVSDPLIKDIKECNVCCICIDRFLVISENDHRALKQHGASILYNLCQRYTIKLFNEFQTCNTITDSNDSLIKFCKVLEDIFNKGLIPNQNTFYGNKKLNVYAWMCSVATEGANFTYKNCIDQVQSNKGVNTSLGRFRLLIRHCLMRKCLHVPLELLNASNKTFYEKNSILGDEILSAILLSVLLQCSKINFQLQLDNYAFLDLVWELPEMVKLEVVPCKNLGISISFSDNKAVIVDIKSNSVASEFSEISTGDILSKLNHVEINSSCKGRLNTILHSKPGRPVTLVIIKAFDRLSQDIFPPIKTLLCNLHIDIDKIKNPQSEIVKSSTKAGYKATYLGFIDVGNNGSVRQIEEAIKRRSILPESTKEPVIFEIGELAVKVFSQKTNDMVLKHSYMQISSCGSASRLPNYVAYIAGNENCDTASKFVCYIFYVEDGEDACTILQSIGQGFCRTHFAV